MIKLHFRIKLRVFGITLGTVEDTRDITAIFTPLIRQWAGVASVFTAAALTLPAASRSTTTGACSSSLSDSMSLVKSGL